MARGVRGGFPRTGPGLKARGAAVKKSRASMPNSSPARASAGYTPPGGGGSGSPKSTSPLTSSPKKIVTSKPAGGSKRGINLNPRADGASRI